MTADSPIVELTWREAEGRFQRRVDRRMRYATDGVQLLVLLRWTEACTGCCVLGCDWDQGVGCRECRFTGKRRVEIWHPERLWAANKPPQGGPMVTRLVAAPSPRTATACRVIRGAGNRCSVDQRVWSAEARKTPPAFARFLVELARRARPLVALALLLVACAYPPPEHYSIDDAFSPAQAETIRAAFDAWCDAAGYCPTEVLYAERGRVMLVDDLPEDERTIRDCPEAFECSVSATNSGLDEILVARNRSHPDDLDRLWWIVTHEIGHYCTEHTRGGLMAASPDTSGELIIDDEAIAAWRRCDRTWFDRF